MEHSVKVDELRALQAQISALLSQQPADLDAALSLMQLLQDGIDYLQTIAKPEQATVLFLEETMQWLSQHEKDLLAEKQEIAELLNKVQKRRHVSKTYRSNSQ